MERRKKSNSLVGIPFSFEREDEKGCHCIGLARMFYRARGWPEDFDDGLPVTRENHGTPETWTRLIKYLHKHFDKISLDALAFGDFVLFDVGGDVHTGIYLGYGKLLAHQVPCVEGKTMSTIYHREWWTPFFKGAYRRKGGGRDGSIETGSARRC